jgi:hypothetical protein
MFVLCSVCVVRWRSLRRTNHSSRGVLPSVVCLNEYDYGSPSRGWPGPDLGPCATEKEKSNPYAVFLERMYEVSRRFS